MPASLDEHRRRFLDYAEGFLGSDPDADFPIRLKIDHTLRVADQARVIVEAEEFPEHTARLSRLAALYHDLGRFTQFREFGTFRDADSVNHGRRGALILRDPRFLDGEPPADRRTVRAAVGLHNVRSLSERTPEPLASVTKVVRDSDKLDILPILIEHFAGRGSRNDVVTMDLPELPDHFNRAMLADIVAGRTGDYGKLECLNDFRLLLVSWVYDLNYPASFARLLEIRALDTLFDPLPDDPEITGLRGTIDTLVKNAAMRGKMA